MNPMQIAADEMFINACVGTMKEAMEMGVEHDKIIDFQELALRDGYLSPLMTAEEREERLIRVLARALYHLTNMQMHNRN